MNENRILEVGDQANSWVGVALLQELFLKEHNAVAREIAKNNPELAGNDNPAEWYGVLARHCH